MSVLIFDTETGTKTAFKRKASPFHPDNYVVALGWMMLDDKKVTGTYFDKSHRSSWLAPLLARSSLLVGHNIKFDILWALTNPDDRIAWMQWVAGGGRIWDTQLAEYLLQGMRQEYHMIGLNDLAPEYGGTEKVDEVKLLWESGVDTPDIERDLLMGYLCGNEAVDGDVQNTKRVFAGQLAKARQRGQVNSIMLNMDALIYTIEAELNGMYVDVELGHKLAKELEVEQAALKEKLESAIPDDLPFEFNWGSRTQLSALLFGGTAKYVGKELVLDEAGKVQYPKQEATQVTFSIWGEEQDVIVPLDWLDTDDTAAKYLLTRYAGGQKKGQIKSKKASIPDTSKPPKMRNCDLTYTFPGVTTPDPAWKSQVEGVYSTASEVIEVLGNRNIPFLKDFSRHAAIVKDLGTYFLTTDEHGKSKGMLTLVDRNLIHHALNMCSTVTGRLSSSQPNLQNLPKGKKSKVKQVFRSRYPGGKIVQSDFSALEIYIQAILTGCTKLLEELHKGTDMHCLRLSVKEGMPYEEVFKLCKGYTDEKGVWHDSVKEWDYKRTEAKVFSFQRAYGAGAKKIAESTGMALEDVQALIEAEEKLFPEIAAYFDRKAASIAAGSVSVGNTLPHPDFPAKMCDLRVGYSCTPDGKRYSYKQSFAPDYVVKREGVFTTFAPTEIKNYEVQGSGAEWAKAAMALTVRAFYKLNNFNGLACIINQVHDAEYADTHPDVAVDVAAVVHVCMEQASEYMQHLFKWRLPIYVPSDTTIGDSMADEEPLPEAAFKAAQDKYRNLVRSHYDKSVK